MVIATCKVLIRAVHVIGLNDLNEGNTALHWSRILTDGRCLTMRFTSGQD